MTTVQLLAVDELSVDILKSTHGLNTFQVNVSLSSQCLERNVGGENGKAALGPRTDVFSNDDESSKNEDFTTEKGETDKALLRIQKMRKRQQ